MSHSNMPPDEVLAVLDEAIRHAEERGHMNRSDNLQSSRTAVAALIAERDGAIQARDIARAMASDLMRSNAALEAERDALREDAKRLDWLDANNLPKSIGWKVGVAPLGNAAVSSVVFLGSKPVTIRQAIDAARAEAGHG